MVYIYLFYLMAFARHAKPKPRIIYHVRYYQTIMRLYGVGFQWPTPYNLCVLVTMRII